MIGSCWAFSRVATVDGINQIVTTGNLTLLSEQELIDCDKPYNNGCNEGLMDYAFAFIVSNGGRHKEENYPYLMEEGTCGMEKVMPRGRASILYYLFCFSFSFFFSLIIHL